MQTATLGGGCYWCLEAFYQRIIGIEKVVSGYSGGHTENPTIEEVYAGSTGHAEVVQLMFDPQIISYQEILKIFYVMHDPTTLNRQNYDIGEEYRSIILYHDDEQKRVAERITIDFAAPLYPDPIVTEIKPFEAFWPAEADMQNFYNNSPNAGYCMVVIDPKIQKLRQKFAGKLKPSV